jgi:glycosyltransferase involved in cell wall biosynthesis
MSILQSITPLILTYNEAPNIERTLINLLWANQIVVIDSFSDDQTLDIIKNFSNIILFQRMFDTFAQQWNYGLQQTQTDLVLSLDADYIVSSQLLKEIESLTLNDTVNSYYVRFKYCVFGKPLKGSLLPPRQVLFKKKYALYINDGHTQLLTVQGNSDKLSEYIYHDDRKALNRWLISQDHYMLDEVKKLFETPFDQLSLSDRIRKHKILAPFLVLIYCLILKGGLFDGWHGWYYALQRLLAEVLLAIRLLEYEKTQNLNFPRNN